MGYNNEEMIATYAVDHTVIIRDRAYLVAIYREAVVAVGNYMGQQIEVRASSPAEAEKHWITAAYDWDVEHQEGPQKGARGTKRGDP
jgi:hypothetical protein